MVVVDEKCTVKWIKTPSLCQCWWSHTVKQTSVSSDLISYATYLPGWLTTTAGSIWMSVASSAASSAEGSDTYVIRLHTLYVPPYSVRDLPQLLSVFFVFFSVFLRNSYASVALYDLNDFNDSVSEEVKHNTDWSCAYLFLCLLGTITTTEKRVPWWPERSSSWRGTGRFPAAGGSSRLCGAWR